MFGTLKDKLYDFEKARLDISDPSYLSSSIFASRQDGSYLITAKINSKTHSEALRMRS